MPRKTKKQKIKAAARQQNQTALPESVKGEFDFNFSTINFQKYKNKKGDPSFQLEQIKLIRLDLLKTALIALGIFSLELVIYWAWF